MAKDAYKVARNDALWPCGTMNRADFVTRIWEEGGESYRDLPWRNISDAYAVLVSEVMLQQTQVSRVKRYWPQFMDAFPTIEALASASTKEVLSLWQGLGYNRRALSLKRSADELLTHGCEELPNSFDELIALPGIGPATAAGVLAFAFELPAVYLETNVRAVFIHELFPDADKVPDADLLPYVADTASHADPRGWNYALLDYGATLKRSGSNPSRASTAYARQSAFEGSRRQKRAEVVRIVLDAAEGMPLDAVREALDAVEVAQGRCAVDESLFNSLISDLIQEGFLSQQDSLLFVAE